MYYNERGKREGEGQVPGLHLLLTHELTTGSRRSVHGSKRETERHRQGSSVHGSTGDWGDFAAVKALVDG